MRRCKIIGLTGQSGAGKSTAARLFRENGFTVVNADELVKKIYDSGSVCLRAVAATFGDDIIYADGSLNRSLLAQRAFCSAENTALLGQLVHPFVTAELLKLLKSFDGAAVVYDAPQLFESNADAVCDRVICVAADEELRLQRIVERDGISRERAKERVDAQLDEDFFLRHADYVIHNNGGLEQFGAQTEEIIKRLQAEGFHGK